jgi:asparagine synthase (glutamine-hydrolysing)
VCGIAGIVFFNDRDVDASLVRGMTDAMSHRGPDSDGFFTQGQVGLGHRRLSIIDLSTAANQPFTDVSGRYVMVFNGEIYNYNEVKQQLTDYPFHTTSDTEVLLAAYIKWGADCMRPLRGMYAFAIWDRQEKQLFLARDKMGVKPLYYYADDDKLLFASEIRAILGTGLVPRKLNPEAVREFFTYQSVTGTSSIIDGIHQLDAGHWMRIRKGSVEKKAYWDVVESALSHRDEPFTDKGTIHKRIRELLLRSIERRLVSDVPVGAFLSGGIDSSAVVGLMAEAGPSRPNTFNIYFEEKEYDESSYADIIAKKFNTHHTRILLKPGDFLGELQHSLDALDTPSGDGVNTYVVSQQIRQKGMTVALSGVGGDELFAGYPYFDQYLTLNSNSWLWKLPYFIRRMAAARQPAGSRKQRMLQLLQSKGPGIENSYPVFRQILAPAQLRELTSIRGINRPTELENFLQTRKDLLHRLPLLSQVSAAEYYGYTQHTLLKDTDQMSMAVSLEVREPFFDQDLVEYVLAVPDTFKKPSYPKSLLVESLKPLLPDEIVFRKKQGFLFPWNVWLKNDLRSFCEGQIGRMAQRDFIDGKRLTASWQRFLTGDPGIRWSEIWLFVVLEYWLEKNNIA